MEFIYNEEGKCYYLQDKGSRNGTYINGSLISEVNNGEEVSMLALFLFVITALAKIND